MAAVKISMGGSMGGKLECPPLLFTDNSRVRYPFSDVNTKATGLFTNGTISIATSPPSSRRNSAFTPCFSNS